MRHPDCPKHSRKKMKLSAALLLILLIKNPSPINAANNINECQTSPYPCAGGNRIGSFCVDYDPPKKFKCGCLPGYEALLPNASDVMDNVTIEWRPSSALQTMSASVLFVMRMQAALYRLTTRLFAFAPATSSVTASPIVHLPPRLLLEQSLPCQSKSGICHVNSDCDKLENSVCVDGVCKCKTGFYHSNAKANCKNENECADGYPNDCHKNAICKDTEGGYTCTCKDGYSDLNPDNKAGTICAQINECINSSMNDCNAETQVCVDLPPPSKWQCVEHTPAPTPVVEAFCYNDHAGMLPDTGCTEATPFCDADPGKGGNRCVECIDDKSSNPDSGCDKDYFARICVETSVGGSCGECIDDKQGGDTDLGCEIWNFGEGFLQLPYCLRNKKGRNTCGTCIDDKAHIDPNVPDFGCDTSTPFCGVVVVLVLICLSGINVINASTTSWKTVKIQAVLMAKPLCLADSGELGYCGVCNSDRTVCGDCINNEEDDTLTPNRDAGCTDVNFPYCKAEPDEIGYECGQCINNEEGTNADAGCTDAKPYCDADPGKPGSCAPCIDDNSEASSDSGCTDSNRPQCFWKWPNGNVCGNCFNGQCGECIDNSSGGVDKGCDVTTPNCDVSVYRPVCRSLSVSQHLKRILFVMITFMGMKSNTIPGTW
jgi:hypothetical protein